MPKTILANAPVRGTRYRLNPGEFERLVSPGDTLYIQPEPDNEFDPRAIAIYCRDRVEEAKRADPSEPERETVYRHIGYIPKESTGPVHAEIQAGHRIQVTAEAGQNFSLHSDEDQETDQ